MTRREKAKQWRQIIGRQEKSDQNIKEYCVRHRITEASFYYWRKRLGNTSRDTMSSRFLRIEPMNHMPPSDHSLSITTPNGYRVDIQGDRVVEKALEVLQGIHHL